MKTAFLDSSVIVQALKGSGASSRLLGPEVRGRIRVATNPVVLQEIFAIAEVRRNPELLDKLQSQLTMLPVDFARSAELLSRVSDLRNRIAHSNDLLAFGSAAD